MCIIVLASLSNMLGLRRRPERTQSPLCMLGSGKGFVICSASLMVLDKFHVDHVCPGRGIARLGIRGSSTHLALDVGPHEMPKFKMSNPLDQSWLCSCQVYSYAFTSISNCASK